MGTKKMRKIFIVEREDEKSEDNQGVLIQDKDKVKKKDEDEEEEERDSDPPGESGTVVIDHLASHRLY